MDQFHIRADRERRIDIHSHKLRQRIRLSRLIPVSDSACVFPIAGTPAFRTGNVYVRKELHIQADDSRAITHRTAQPACIIGKIARLITQLLCLRHPGKNFPQLIVNVRIRRHGGTDVDADGRGVDELHPLDAFRLHCFHMFRQFLSGNDCFQTGYQAFQNQRRLAGA